MKKGLLGIIAVVVSFWTASAASGGAPALTATKIDADFGTVVQGAKVEHTFTFNNGGQGDLIIHQVRSSCGCTAALLSATRIPPGGKGELRAVFDSERFRGAVSKTVYLHTNDPARSVVEFTLRGKVRPQVEASPEQLDLGSGNGSVKEGTVTLVNRGVVPLVLSSARATAPEIQVKMASGPLAPGESRLAKVRVTGTPQTPRINGYILIPVQGGVSQEVRIPVFALFAEAR